MQEYLQYMKYCKNICCAIVVLDNKLYMKHGAYFKIVRNKFQYLGHYIFMIIQTIKI